MSRSRKAQLTNKRRCEIAFLVPAGEFRLTCRRKQRCWLLPAPKVQVLFPAAPPCSCLKEGTAVLNLRLPTRERAADPALAIAK